MDDREFGFFVRCLNHSWVNGGLPGNIDELAKVLGRSKHHLARVWPVVSQCFELKDGRYYNIRLEAERSHAQATSVARTRASAIRWDAKAMQLHSKCNANGDANALNEKLF
jgi:uncharacterized protein YdaU (DUF1376 family)